MNERIQELAWEAEDYAESIVDQGGGFHQAYTRKFAELIVRECAKVAEQWYSDYPKDDRLVSECIMETFGVKNDND